MLGERALDNRWQLCVNAKAGSKGFLCNFWSRYVKGVFIGTQRNRRLFRGRSFECAGNAVVFSVAELGSLNNDPCINQGFYKDEEITSI